MQARKKNIAGYVDDQGRFRPIRSPEFVGTGSGRKRKATAKDRRAYSRAKAGDLGADKQARATEAPWDKELREQREAKEAGDRFDRQLQRQLEREAFGGESSGRGETLVQFVRSHGGLRRTFRHGGRKGATGERSGWDSGEIDRLSYKETGKRGLTTDDGRRGKTLDKMHQAALEAGYAVDSIDDMLEAVEREAAGGRAVYSTHGAMQYNPLFGSAKAKVYRIPALVADGAGGFEGVYVLVNEQSKRLYDDGGTGTIYGQLADGSDLRGIRAGSLVKVKLMGSTASQPARVLKSGVKTGRRRNPKNTAIVAGKASVRANPVRKYVVLVGGKKNGGHTSKFEYADLAAARKWASDARKQGFTAKVVKKNPDPAATFAHLAGGLLSAVQLHQVVTRKPAAKKRKRRTSTAVRVTTNPKTPSGDLYLMTVKRGDDLLAVYVHDGKADGLNKKFKTIATARAFATRSKRKLVENPGLVVKNGHILTASGRKPNGIVSKLLAKLKADREFNKALIKKAAEERKTLRKAKKLANPRKIGLTEQPRRTSSQGTRGRMRRGGQMKHAPRKRVGRTARKTTRQENLHRNPVATPAGKGARVPTRKRKNPAPRKLPRSKAFEMFQGRPVTNGRQLPVSKHVGNPKTNLAELGKLHEIKLVDEKRPLVFNPAKFVLVARGGRMQIAGGKIARSDAKQARNVLNPIGHIDHVVYETYKPHHGDPPGTHYIHHLGEEGGYLPLLCVDNEGFPVIKDGSYKIRAEGIRD